MATIKVEYLGENGKPQTVEYTDVEAVVDLQTQILTLVRHGVQTGGLTLDVTVAEFPEGRYTRYETVGEKQASAPSVTRFEMVAPREARDEGTEEQG